VTSVISCRDFLINHLQSYENW